MNDPRRLLASVLSLSLLAASVPPGVWAAEQQGRGTQGVPAVGGVVAQPGDIIAGPQALAPSAMNGVGSAADAAVVASPAEAAANGVAAAAAAGASQTTPVGNDAIASLRSAVGAQDQNGRTPNAASGDVTFDGAAQGRRDDGVLAAVRAPLEWLRKSALDHFSPNPSSASDFHHGPSHAPLTLKQQAMYGLKWGVYLTGMAEVVRQGVSALSGLLPWQATFAQIVPKLNQLPVIGSWLPDFSAAGESRMELLVNWGPHKIAEALSSEPVTFLLYELPKAVALETLYYQVALFGASVIALRSLRPAADWLAARLSGADDAKIFGLKKALALAPAAMKGLSRWAFPLAAAASALAFGADHLAAWGFNAAAFLIPATLGAALAYVTYKTRSFVPALVAHFSYNALLLAGVALAAVSTQAAGLYSTLVPLAAVGFLAYGLYGRLRENATGWGLAKKAATLGGAAAATVGAGLVAATLLAGPMSQAPGVAQTEAQKPKLELSLAKPGDKDLTVEQVVERNKPAEVQIVVRFAGGAGTGSGSIIDPSGLIVTNNHVIDAVGVGAVVMVRLSNGESSPARVLAANKRVDLALLQLLEDAPEGGWPVVAFGDSDELKEGQPIVAMGHPFGFPFTVTAGHISGLGESQRRPYPIQHDAAVNPGNSGGGLFDMKGNFIGVNTAIFSKTGNFAGISYARASGQVLVVLQQYLATGTISPGWLGIVIDKSNPLLSSQGVLVDAVRPGSPAQKAGLQPGDLIVSVNGQALPPGAQASAGALAMMIESKASGEKVTLSVLRDEQSVTLQVTVGEMLSHPHPKKDGKGIPMPHADPDTGDAS